MTVVAVRVGMRALLIPENAPLPAETVTVYGPIDSGDLIAGSTAAVMRRRARPRRRRLPFDSPVDVWPVRVADVVPRRSYL